MQKFLEIKIIDFESLKFIRLSFNYIKLKNRIDDYKKILVKKNCLERNPILL